MAGDLPTSVADSWRSVGTRTSEATVLVATITAETTVYEPAEPTERPGGVDESGIPARSLFVVDLTVSPPPTVLGISPPAVFSTAAPKAKAQFVATLEDEGLTVEETRDALEFEAANGATGTWYVLDVGYPVDSDLSSGERRWLEAEAHVAVWPTDRSYGMAGGTVPLESVADAVDGDVARAVDEQGERFPVDPERDRETIAELVRAVDVGTGRPPDAE